ncbi:MAG: metal ABC transporter permease [Clostridia bacterium]|nr:metal ABC transporter permease [Clostridia bacterium]
MMEIIKTLFSYSFIMRAVIVGILVSLCSSVLGVSLVLKRYSMIGDGLSHVSFGALAIAAALNSSPLMVSVPIVVIAAFFLLKISKNSFLGGDAAIAIFSSSALAVGIVVTSMTSGINADICNYMFGSILAMSESDVYISVILSAIVLILYLLFYNRIFAITFDENFSRATGSRTDLYNMAVAVLTAITIVLGMRIMGALLISSLIIFPALSAMRICRFFRGVILCSAIISVLCFFTGIVLSYALEVPVGASVVLVNLAVFMLSSLRAKIKA